MDFVMETTLWLQQQKTRSLQRKFETRRIGMTGKHLDRDLEVLHRFVKVFNSALM